MKNDIVIFNMKSNFLFIFGLLISLVAANEDTLNQTEIISSIQDEIVSTDLPSLAENTTSVIPVPSITIHITGMSPSDFRINRDRFAVIMSNVTNFFIIDKEIKVKASNPSNIQLQSIENCPAGDSNNDNCTKLTLSIPLALIEDEINNNGSLQLNVDQEPATYLTNVELSKEHLLELWNTYSTHSIIKEFGVQPYQPTNDLVLLVWISISLGIICAFLVVLYIIWKSDLFANYSSLGDKLIPPRNSHSDHSRPSNTDTIFDIVNRTNTQGAFVAGQNTQSRIAPPKYDVTNTEKSFTPNYKRKSTGTTLPTVAEEQNDGFINIALDSEDESDYETEFTLKNIQKAQSDKRPDSSNTKTNTRESMA